MLSKKIPWQNPLPFAQKIIDNYAIENPDDNFVFLYSGLNEVVKNSITYLAIFSKEKLITDDFFYAQKIIKNSSQKWFGYFSYELASQFENISSTLQSHIQNHKIHLEQFHLIFEFNHSKKIITANFDDPKYFDLAIAYRQKKVKKNPIKIEKITSNFSDESYLNSIEKIRKKIAEGQLFQLNLTRKFYGEFTNKIDLTLAFELFKKHYHYSKINYSSLLKFGDLITISASPELFFKVKNNKIISCPIKGTAPRCDIKKIDIQNKKNLKNSSKERGENLMIVDLVRSDLSRFCKVGSVIVKKLFAITSYKNIHHMSSQIEGQLPQNFDAIDCIPALFPPGSMTGAPKIMAMNLIADAEKIDRGIYSGAIGIIDGKNNLNFAVVIRTLIINKNKFELQFGGGITYDSNPQFELAEVYNKANSWFKVLGIKMLFRE
jgi:para-aminobenzoate synthetase component 1